ncbi:MAG: LysR family transcriptional regulator [Elusimicrobia bacterium]|nr:LysR family transcriptional regulator [Elusimicrobiota bacterium]
MLALNHHHLYYFWVVAKEGSVTKACKKLLLAQPTVSSQIIQLEKSLGKKLFARDKKRLALTEDGRLVLDYAEAIFNTAQELLDALRDRPTQRSLRIQAGVVDQVSKQVARLLLQEIYRFKPDAHVTLLEGTQQAMLAELASHAVDVVLTNVEIPVDKAPEFERVALGSLPVIFVASPALSRKVKTFPSDLAKIPLLLPTQASPVWGDSQHYLNKSKVEPRIAGEIQDVELLRQLVIDGVGAAPINKLTVAEDLRSGRLISLCRDQGQLEETVWLLAKKRHRLNPIAEHLLRDYRPSLPAR